MKRWLIRTATSVGLAIFVFALWYGGPMIGFADTRPLDSIWVRGAIIAVVLLAVGGYYGFKWWRKRAGQKKLEKALAQTEAESSDAKVLGERMTEALDTLKKSSGKSNFLYELPWYIIIGPPGAGKTTALVNSGLKFPLAGNEGAQPVAGVGGTRYCDWWFTEEAVLIDTAGRYTTHDSDADSDKKSWQAFLSLLKGTRAKQPINGVIVAISLEDLMKLNGQELAAHSVAIRKRLLEIHEQLRIDFPVYTLFTKADLIAGFAEFFGNFTESRRRKVWGATFQTQDRKKNMVGQVPTEFDALVRRLTEETTDRLHEEPDPIARIAIFGFPAQFATLRERIADFLNRIFEPNRYQVNANLRGFYFSSGTQEGTPIDQVLGAIGRSFGDPGAGAHMSGSGKSFFLHDLMSKVIFAESGWVSRDMAAVRRAAIIRYGAISLMALVSIGALSAWGVSFATNRGLIGSTDNAVETYRINADEFLKADTVSDTDVDKVVGVLTALRNLPVGYENRDAPTPVQETFGLSQRGRLLSASESTYRKALERMFRSRLILQLERSIETNINEPIYLYEALKVYLMLGGKAPKTDNDLIVAWMGQDWEDRYPGPSNRALRTELAGHLTAMLDLSESYDPLFDLNGPLVESAQRSIARMSMADRAYALIKSASHGEAIEDFSVADRGGPDSALVFETIDGSDLANAKVPALYTYAGFNDFFLTQLAAVAERLADEQWVMGEVGQQQAVDEQFQRLGPELLDRYGKDFVEAWNTVLDNLKLKQLSADKPQYVALSAASSPTSPIKLLFEAVARETMLTEDREEDTEQQSASGGSNTSLTQDVTQIIAQRLEARTSGLARIGIQLARKKSQSRAGSGVGGGGSASNQIPGANIEAQFKPYQMLVEGQAGKRPIDALVQNFYEVYQSLILSATNPSQTERANANLQLQIVNLRANASRLPRPLARMVNSAVDDFEGDAAGSSIAQLNQMLAATVSRPCEQVVANRYPFSRASDRDVPMADFARLFAPNGVIDRFFAQNLSQLVDSSGSTWVWKQDSRLGRELSKGTLKEFQRAAAIRDAFFPQGGAMPAVTVTVTPFSLHGQADMALLNVNGQVVQSQQVGSLPGTLNWPGSMGSGSVSLSLHPEIPGRSSELIINGPWAFMRLLDFGSVSKSGDAIQARFVIGGRDVAYTLQVGSLANPFFLPALSEFSCPSGL